MRDIQEPVVTPDKHGHGEVYTHPAYAQISASRCQGGGVRLYDSDFEHSDFVEIRIAPSEWHRDLNSNWYHADTQPYIEVRLSEAQWASFVTCMNSGGGTPCTLTAKDGKVIPGLPEIREQDIAEAEFKNRLSSLADTIRKAIAETEKHIDKLSKTNQRAVMAPLWNVLQEVTSNMPFAARCFSEHVEQSVERAKQEIEAHVYNRITQAGLAAIQGGEPIKLLKDAES